MDRKDARSWTKDQKQAARKKAAWHFAKFERIFMVHLARKLKVSRQTLHGWRRQYETGKGLKLRDRVRHYLITGSQCSELENILCQNLPDEIGLTDKLWSKRAVKRLVQKKYNLDLSLPVIGRFLENYSFIPAGNYNSSWLCCSSDETQNLPLPDYAKQLKRQLYYMYSLSHPKKLCNSLYALTPRKHINFMVIDYKTSERILDFLVRLQKQAKKKIVVAYVDAWVRCLNASVAKEMWHFRTYGYFQRNCPISVNNLILRRVNVKVPTPYQRFEYSVFEDLPEWW